jgi:H+-transporting ATPase
MILQIWLDQYVEAAAIAALLLFNGTLGFVQEGRANTALAALKKRLELVVMARRDGEWVRLQASELVPGDVIKLSLGSMVPADAHLLSGSLLLDQSTLTGESVPINAAVGDGVFAGSLVRRGEALAEVTATGTGTHFGKTTELVRTARSPSTEQTAVLGVTRNLMIVNGIIAVIIVAYAFITALPFNRIVSLALTALLATIPAALPAVFTLSAALSAQTLSRHGVLLTRLSAANEAAGIDILCADKTGTLTYNQLGVAEVVAMPGFDRDRVLALAALASSEADQDPIDIAIRTSVTKSAPEKLLRFVPFDPGLRVAEAIVSDKDGKELHVIKGAFEAVKRSLVEAPADAEQTEDRLAGQGNRVITVAMGPADALRLTGFIAISDPPREDSADLVAALRDLGVRTIMLTGDSEATAAAVARKVGIDGDVCSFDKFVDASAVDKYAVFARVVPEDKYRLVRALQSRGHQVGMCGDGTNDAPALKQAQLGIAVSHATDVAKAASGVVLTEPGLVGIVHVVREGRMSFQRLLNYTLNMLTKKIEIVLFLTVGLVMTGYAVLTPVMVVLMLVINDFMGMSLITDRVSPAPDPSRWRMNSITIAAVILGLCKLCFSTALLAFGRYWLMLGAGELQTLAFVIIIFGSQTLMYVVRERHHLWSSKPSNWILLSSTIDAAIASALALSGTLMAPLPWSMLLGVLVASLCFAFLLDPVKLRVESTFNLA